MRLRDLVDWRYGGKKLPFGTFSDRVWQLKGVLSMATNVKLSDDLVKAAGRIAAIEHRSVPKQIEFYFKIAAIAEANPELSFALIKEILKSDAEATIGRYQLAITTRVSTSSRPQ